MPLELLHIDAFTDRPFTGNPAAVAVLDRPAPDGWMQQVAAELALSETAFVVGTAPGRWDLRWFTPTVEVDLCGHATLAAAHALVTGHGVDDPVLTFATRSGDLTARVLAPGRYELDLPTDRPEVLAPDAVLPGLLDALGVAPGVTVARGRVDVLVELADADAVRAVDPDLRALAALPVRLVVVTAPGGDGVDCTSRCFAPGSGIDEDPVTGSAHCLVGPWWVERLGRNPLTAFQASARGGTLGVTVDGDRVRLAGDAVTVSHIGLADAASP